MSRAVHALITVVLLPLSAACLPLAAQGRPDVQGTEAAVVADHPLAVAAGANVLRRGGNAVDAAITMAAVLAVVRPHMNGIGGDAFMLIRDGRSGRVHALNGSGRAGAAATPGAFRARGLSAVPATGVLSATVPGAPRAWADALRRHGSIPWAAALEPAAQLAANGFPVSTRLSADIAAARGRLEADPLLAATYLPGGQPPVAGSLLRQPDLARTLETLARDGVDAMYTGEIAGSILQMMQRERGFLTAEDLAAHSSTWQQPIATTYQGYRVLALPPNSQGIALLMQMNMADLFDMRAFGHNEGEYIHSLVEIKRLAFAERDRHVADPAFTEIPLDDMLSERAALRLLDTWARAPLPPRRHPGASEGGSAGASSGEERHGDGDTVFLGVVDSQGNAVAIIQSLYNSFGCACMVPGTGIILHNRAALFTLDPAHVNAVAPGKRPYHTLAPAMVLNGDNSLFMVLGSPGSDGQTQTLLQVFNNIVLFGMTPQQAVEAPRWRSWENGTLQIEAGVSDRALARLRMLGHEVRLQATPSAELGGAQVIVAWPNGVRTVGADPRREAYGMAW